MTANIYPAFDQFAAVSDERERALTRQALRDFSQQHPEFSEPDSLQVLTEFCSVQCVPITLRNLEIGLQSAIDEGTLDPATASENFAAQKFLETCPEYENGYANRANADRLLAYLRGKGLPVTVENLRSAFAECLRRKLVRPVTTGFGGSAHAIFARDSVTAEDRQRYHDQPFESDLARKKRDEALRRAATAERYARIRGRE